MKKIKKKYKELAKATIQPTRKLIISKTEDGGFILTQQLIASEGNKETRVMLKGSIYLSDLNAVYNLRDALNIALNEIS